MEYFKTDKDYFHKKGSQIMAISLKNGTDFSISKIDFLPKNAIKSTQNEFDTLFKKLISLA